MSALCAIPCRAQDDTARRPVMLPQVHIIELNSHPEATLTQTPTQVATAEAIERLGDVQLSDVLRRMAGVTLKDYGGIGGIKTVSARGLGSQFSTLTIDGIAVTDCQNGQVDLGRYMLAGSSYISLSNGHDEGTLTSVRALAAGSSVNMQTHEPEFGSRPFNLRVGLEGGSFALVSPTLNYEQRLGSRTSLSAWMSYMGSDGNYPFTLYYTAGRTDSSSRELRENSQVRIANADINLFHRTAGGDRLHVKARYMQGYHALPGPVIYYTRRGSEHSQEQLSIVQAQYRHNGRHWDWQIMAKHQRSNDVYEDTAVLNIGTIHYEYQQGEYYLSQALRYHSASGHDGLTLSLSADEAVDMLNTNLPKHNEVRRMAALCAFTAEYAPRGVRMLEGLRFNAHLLGTWMRDYEPDITGEAYTRMSPYIGVSRRWGHYTLRYFFKDTYRVPNFNELYYYTVGHNLRPEKASQHNLGLTYRSDQWQTTHAVAAVSATADVYYNQVTDKIIAIPMQNMFLWSMANMDRVEVRGLDITANACMQSHSLPHWRVDASLTYTYQYAVDRTNPEGKTYGHQIPYTPRHSGNATITVSTQWGDFAYTLMAVGPRYALKQNTQQNRVAGYVDQGITISHEWDLPHSSLRLRGQVLNIFDVQYEVVRNYPMMGRNYRIGLTWTL